jgi:putative chitinase
VSSILLISEGTQMSDNATTIVAIGANDLLVTVLLAGGLMGAIGQGMRSAMGLKKLRDKSGSSDAQFSQEFSASRFLTSIFIGATVGALTAFLISDEQMKLVLTKQVLIGLMAAGYAGTDTIEGLASKVLPGMTQAK